MATILIIEDNAELRMLFSMVLSAEHNILEASDGAQGLELCRQHQPDLIITDMSMPKLSGLNLIRALRAEENKVKIIACSALFNQGTDMEAAMQAGADLCLTKPVSIDHLIDAVNEMLNK
jgi:two-component system chemotaxis response regulator CheY